MARPKLINKKNLTEAIKGSYGNQSIIAKRLNCTYQTIWNAFKEFPELKSLLEDERENLVGSAEWVVAEAIVKKKDVKTAMWVLDRENRKNCSLEIGGINDNELKIVFTDKLEDNSNEEER